MKELLNVLQRIDNFVKVVYKPSFKAIKLMIGKRRINKALVIMSEYKVTTAKDLSYLNSWWQEIHGHLLPSTFLPPNKFYIVQDEKPVAYFGMHGMECDICYMGFPTIKKGVPNSERQEIYSVMCKSAGEWAKKAGYKLIFISLMVRGAVESFLKNGFDYGEDSVKGSLDAKHLFMKV